MGAGADVIQYDLSIGLSVSRSVLQRIQMDMQRTITTSRQLLDGLRAHQRAWQIDKSLVGSAQVARNLLQAGRYLSFLTRRHHDDLRLGETRHRVGVARHDIRAVRNRLAEPSFARVLDVEDVLRMLVKLRIAYLFAALLDEKWTVVAQRNSWGGTKDALDQKPLNCHREIGVDFRSAVVLRSKTAAW